KKIDECIGGLIENPVQTTAIDGNSFLIDKVTAERIIEMISETYDDKQGYEWDVQAFLSVLNYLTESIDTNEQGNVWLVIRKNRNISRIRTISKKIEDAPDTAKDELSIAKTLATTVPALILTRQNGAEEKGWRGAPFYWPVLVAPKSTKPTVFANKS